MGFGEADDEVTLWIKKSFAKYIFVLILGALCLLLFLSLYQREQRRSLFCEEIKPGMSLTNVLETINQFGEFGTSQYQPNKDTVILYVVPLDSFGTAMRYGSRGLELGFRDNLLEGVVERYRLEDDIRVLCE